jgi:hypothetical protein
MQAQKIRTFPLVRPTYENKHIQGYGMWLQDNESALQRYFQALCRIPPEGEIVKYELWTVIQWEIEKILKGLS